MTITDLKHIDISDCFEHSEGKLMMIYVKLRIKVLFHIETFEGF